MVSTKSRDLVNRWTGPVLVVNALLLGAGTVVPVVMRVTSAAVVAIAPSLPAPPVPIGSANLGSAPWTAATGHRSPGIRAHRTFETSIA